MADLYGKGLKGRATKLHSLVVRARGVCECCGDTYYPNLQCAHIVTRSRNATRTDENAALCLCRSCHMRFTHDGLEWVRFVDAYLGAGTHDEIQRRSKGGVKANDAFWQGEIDRLSALLKENAA